MKRVVSVFISLLVLLWTCAADAAGLHPTGGLLTFDLDENSELRAKSATSAAYTIGGQLVTGNNVTFTITEPFTGAAEYTLAYVPDWTTNYQSLYNSPSVSFSYHLSMPGKYRVFVRDASGTVLGYTRVLTVTGDDLVAQRVRELISGCTAADDYGKALWAHEWITLNTYYDSTLCWHGADYLLFEGYGVCQSYSELYRKMVIAMGLPCEIVQSSYMGHEWVNVQVKGTWYAADPTWDTLSIAPAGSGSPAAVNDHEYFLVAEEILSYDHSRFQADHFCPSMKDNYYVHTGDADRWLPYAQAEALRLLEGGERSFTITMPTVKGVDNRIDIKAADAAVLLDGSTLQGKRAQYVLTAEHVPSSLRYQSPQILITASAIPVTGDRKPVGLWIVLACGSILLLILLLKRKQH